MQIPILCEPLDRILRSELSVGNEISSVNEGGWTKVDVVVYLKRPFVRNYGGMDESIEFYRNTDPHYDLGDSYTSASARQAVEAPTL